MKEVLSKHGMSHLELQKCWKNSTRNWKMNRWNGNKVKIWLEEYYFYYKINPLLKGIIDNWYYHKLWVKFIILKFDSSNF
jgi:hypothetical protein